MKKTLILILILFLIPVSVFAEFESVNQVLENTDFSEIEKFLKKNQPDIDFKQMLSEVLKGNQAFEIHDLISSVKRIFFIEVKKSVSVLIKLVLACVLLSLLKELSGSGGKKLCENAFFIGHMLSAFVLCNVFVLSVETAKIVIDSLNSFISMSMPILMVLLAGSGAAKTAACVNPVILIGIETISVITKTFFIPLIFALGVLSLFCFSEKYFNLNPLIKTIKSVLKWSMGLVFALFSGLVSIYGSFSSSTDALSFRVAKYVAGTAVPVAGSVISETMGTFFYSCTVVKNAFGTVVISIIAIIAIIPVIKLFLIVAMLNLSALFAGGISEEKMVLQISEMSGAVSYILGLVCLTAFLFIICTAIVIHTANNIII